MSVILLRISIHSTGQTIPIGYHIEASQLYAGEEICEVSGYEGGLGTIGEVDDSAREKKITSCHNFHFSVTSN